MDDLRAMTDVELTERWLSLMVSYPSNMARVVAIDEEAQRRGRARMAAAYREIGERREAARMASQGVAP